MASTAKIGQTARQKAREHRVALEAETKARNDRIEHWTAAFYTGAEDRDRALQAAESAEMAAGLVALSGEGLTTSEIADLCELTLGEAQKLIKRRREGSQQPQPEPRGVGGGASTSAAAAGKKSTAADAGPGAPNQANSPSHAPVGGNDV